jgi:hypothetical protein
MFFFLLLFASVTQAACLDAGVVSEIQKEVAIQVLNLDLCDETRDSHKLLSALSFLKTKPLSSVSSPLDKNLLPEDVWSFLRARVSSFVNEPSCALGQMAFVRAHQPGVVHLCPSFYDSNLTIVERLPTLLHEAHHFDGDNFSHVNCKQGRLNGMRNACDPSLEYGGGYAVEAEVLARLIRSSALSPELRARAKNMALTRATENFNEPVVPYKLETVYLLGEDGSAYLINPADGKLFPAPAMDISQVNLVSRGANLAALPRDGGDAYLLDVLSDFGPLPVEGEVLTSYNKLPKTERPEILAILNEEMFAGSVMRRRVSVAFAANNYETKIDLPFAAQAVYTPEEYGSPEKDVLFLDGGDGLVHPLRLKHGQAFEFLPVERFPEGFRAFTLFQGKRHALRVDGALAVFSGGHWVAAPGGAGKKFRFVSRAFYWAPFLSD